MLRSVLDGLVARLAAERTGAAEAELLWRTFAQLESGSRSGDGSRLTEADFALDKTIIRIAGYGRLAQQYRLLVEAIAGRQAVRAEELARAHNQEKAKSWSRTSRAGLPDPLLNFNTKGLI